MIPALLVFSGMVTCLGAGYFLGFYVGRQQRMTKKEAASILAKASHQNRTYVSKLDVRSAVEFMR